MSTSSEDKLSIQERLQNILDTAPYPTPRHYDLWVDLNLIKCALDEIKSLTMHLDASRGALRTWEIINNSNREKIEQRENMLRTKNDKINELEAELKLSHQANANKLELIETLKNKLKEVEKQYQEKVKEVRELQNTVERLESPTPNVSTHLLTGDCKTSVTDDSITKKQELHAYVSKLNAQSKLDIAEVFVVNPLSVTPEGLVRTDGLKEDDVRQICREEIEKATVEINDFCGQWGVLNDHRLRAGDK